MKFTQKKDCLSCELKCDIHSTLVKDEKSSVEIKPLHAVFKKHEIICKQGAELTHALFLTKGSAKLYIEGLNNRNIILYLIRPPAYIGLLSIFDDPIYSYSVAALEESEVCFIEVDLVKKMYLDNQDLLLSLNRASGKSITNLQRKLISLNQKQIRGRIAENLIYLSELNNSLNFNLGLSRKEIGEMVSISEENTVRLLSEFSKENIISLKGRDIEIRDLSLLKKICELG